MSIVFVKTEVFVTVQIVLTSVTQGRFSSLKMMIVIVEKVFLSIMSLEVEVGLQ